MDSSSTQLDLFLDSHSTREDIKIYFRKRLELAAKEGKIHDEELRLLLAEEEVFLDKADGLFIWMYTILTLIIDTAFDNLPQPHDLSGVGFAVLQEIKLIFVPSYDPQISDPCSHTAAFLQLISSRAIKRLEICHTDTAPSQHTLSALLKAISQFSDSLEMCSLKIRSSGPTRMAARFVLFSQPSLR